MEIEPLVVLGFSDWRAWWLIFLVLEGNELLANSKRIKMSIDLKKLRRELEFVSCRGKTLMV
jgi:hypothetical protein